MTPLEYLEKYGNPSKENIKRLNNGEPVQYIVGNVSFYGNIIDVDKRVLIPRFETEELVENTIKYIKKYNYNSIVDIGTGSGCIAITIKKIFPSMLVDAVDISKDALALAQSNSIKNDTLINFYEGNLLNPLNKKYDIIISNPPYIAYDEEIMDIVKNNEPHLALYADNNGLYYYEEILKNVSNYINKNGLIAFEIGYDQAEKIKQIVQKYLNNYNIEIKKDMTGKDRMVFIKLYE